MKKDYYYFLIIACLFIPVSSFGVDNITGYSTSLSGRVEDDRCNPIISGTVSLYQYNILITSTETSTEGIYQFSSLNSGQYDVRFTYVGFPILEMLNVEIEGGKDYMLNAKLTTGTILNSPIVIEYKKAIMGGCGGTSGGIVIQEKTSRRKKRRDRRKKRRENRRNKRQIKK